MTLIISYKGELLLLILYNLIRWVILIAQPLLVIQILSYMQNSAENSKGIAYGLFLVIFYNVLDIISSLISDQCDFIQSTISVNSKHGIIAMIYDKVLRISRTTNKDFTKGEIINFINVDVEKISNITFDLSNVVRLPFQLIFAIWFLFYYFDFYLSVSVALGVLFILLNLLIGVMREIFQRKICNEKDKRMIIINEIINNIKAIKLNCLEDIFIKKISTIRHKELFYTKISLIVEHFFATLGMMLSSWMVILAMLVYFVCGNNNISLSDGFAILLVFKMLEIPLRYVPQFISLVAEFNVSMKRIHQFLIWKEISPDMIKFDETLISENKDVLINNANFSNGKQFKSKKFNGKLNLFKIVVYSAFFEFKLESIYN